MTVPVALASSIDEEIALLARRYGRANGVGMQILNLVGGQAENLLERLPDSAKGQLESATSAALARSARLAAESRGVVADQAPWLNRVLTAAMGAAGGAGGLPTALAELPVTTTVLMRVIQGVAAEHGFDPGDEAVQADCVRVFAAAGPLAEDDGAETGFLAARVTLTGATLHGLIARVAPRFAAVLGQKLAAQMVPVLGAAAGAAINYAYTSYYQEIAHVHFGLRRLARERAVSETELTERLRIAMAAARAARAPRRAV